MTEEMSIDELLRDTNFRSLLATTMRRVITWDEFLTMPQPSNMSPLHTWSVLLELGRTVGLETKPDDLDGTEFWYRRTYQIDDIASTLYCACRYGSHLHKLISGAEGQHFLVRSRVEETIAAARLDGLLVASQDAGAILRTERTPQTPNERLLLNSFRTFKRLEDFKSVPFSIELFRHLAELLTEGVDMDLVQTEPPRQGLLVGTSDYTEERIQQHAETQMQGMADYINHKNSDPEDLAVLQGLISADAFRYYRPLGLVSSQVGRLCGRLYAIKQGLPVLGLLPTSRAKLDWEMGKIKPPHVSLDPREFAMLRERSMGDLTPHQTLALELTLYTLQTIQRYIAQWERRDDEMREILRHEPLLNQRQRSILARALRSPKAEFRIRYHQTNHNVAYTTARRDLLELQEKGYLDMELRGKAFVFLRGARLDELEFRRA